MNREVVRRILQFNLKFDPYKITDKRTILKCKWFSYSKQLIIHLQRVDYAVGLQTLLRNNPNAILVISHLFHFYLSGFVNKQNVRRPLKIPTKSTSKLKIYFK